KAAYNGGLFWHTAHYHDAARCSHRSYSRAMSGKSLPAPGGGPANEHNYSSGLLLYYRLSGNRQAAEAVISLADWVLAMDDGRQHLLGCVSSVPTGLATCTRCLHHQGPGRGAGNSIVSLVNAWLVCGLTNYLDQAAELLRRTISPEDDLSEDQLLDAEEHWSYTVYLQALVFFLHATEGLAEYRDAGSYARQSVLHYARWMMAHERPYLDHAEDLEYPTETWAAQDLRKGVVLWMAAALCSEEAERETLQRKGEALLSQAWNSLLSFSTRSCTRPLALVLQQSPLERYFCPLAQQPRRQLSAPPPPADFRPSPVFVPQRILVARQLKSPPQLALMMLRLMRPGPWMQLGRRSWTAERLRHLLRPGP
ncbi:MAG: hypothetical protein KDA45_01450, partial [Planctomycetales bacterium]|nr:hypothetical protein [Planctomycetales bacterium]